jgi:hypothetical protein
MKTMYVPQIQCVLATSFECISHKLSLVLRNVLTENSKIVDKIGNYAFS